MFANIGDLTGNLIFSERNLPLRTQCARMDLNKRFLPKPMTTTG